MPTLSWPSFRGWFGFGNAGGNVTEPQPQVSPEKPAAPKRPIDRSESITYSGLGGFADYCSDLPAYGLDVYRQMRCDPMIAFAYGLCVDPVFAGERQLIVRNPEGGDAAPRRTSRTGTGVEVGAGPEDKRKKAAEDAYEDLWQQVMCGLECLNFGYWVQEVLWERVKDLTAPIAFRSVNPWEIELIPDKFGLFAGFKYTATQTDNERDTRYAFHTVCNPQFGALKGFPKAGVALRSWWRTVRNEENCDRMEQKASGRQMILHIMSGQSFKSGTAARSVSDIMEDVVNTQQKGGISVFPSMAFDKESIKANPKLAEIPAIRPEMIDWGDTGAGLLAAIARLEHLEKKIVRAYGHPEREAMEGTTGTKAEAGVHGEVGKTDSELVGARFYHQFNKAHFNRFLVTNWGPQASDSMYWKMTPLADPQKQLKSDLLKALSTHPVEGPDLNKHFDKRALAKANEVPLIPEDQVVDPPPMPSPADRMNGNDPLARRNGNGRTGPPKPRVPAGPR